MTPDLSRHGDAVISPCGRYRYRLDRVLGDGPVVVFVMLNPSTADAVEDDPTIRRCLGYVRAWGGGRLVAVNLFALRATDPRALRQADDPVGPENRDFVTAAVVEAVKTGGTVVCAWGTHGALHGQGKRVLEWIRAAAGTPTALQLTKDGHPGHPLYLANDLKPVPMPEFEQAGKQT